MIYIDLVSAEVVTHYPFRSIPDLFPTVPSLRFFCNMALNKNSEFRVGFSLEGDSCLSIPPIPPRRVKKNKDLKWMFAFALVIALVLVSCQNPSESAHSSMDPTVGMTLIRAKGQSFMMGDSWETYQDELPQRWIEFDHDYWIGTYEVGRQDFERDTGESSWIQEPARGMNWYEAVLFCNRLSLRYGLDQVYSYSAVEIIESDSGKLPILVDLRAEMTGNGFRLPTEAEWEYACRAGSQTAYYWADTADYRLGQNAYWKMMAYSECATELRGGLEPNTYGLHDMIGNVGEWVFDWYGPYDSTRILNPVGPESGTRKVWRGGYLNISRTIGNTGQEFFRSSSRFSLPPQEVNCMVGLRLARTYPNQSKK